MSEPFVFSNGQVAYNARDLIELCRKFPDDSTDYLLRGDFEKWLAYIDETEFARFARNTREASMAEDKKIAAFTAKCQTVAKQPNLEASPVQPTNETDTAKENTESSRVSLLAIFSQFLYNLLSNRGRKKQEEVPIQSE